MTEIATLNAGQSIPIRHSEPFSNLDAEMVHKHIRIPIFAYN